MTLRVAWILLVVGVLGLPTGLADGEPTSDGPPALPEIPIFYDVGDQSQSVDVKARVDLSLATDAEAVQAAAAQADSTAYAYIGADAPGVSAAIGDAREVDVAAGAATYESEKDGTVIEAYVALPGVGEETQLQPTPGTPDLAAPALASPSLRFLFGPSKPSHEQASAEAASVESESSSLSNAAVTPTSDLVAPLGWTAVFAATTVLASAGATSSGGLGLAGLKKFLARLLPAFGLFTRLSGDDLLNHPRRSEIYDYVRQHPGERLEIVRKATGLANGPMLHHLRILDKGNLVRVMRSDGMARLYPAGPRVQPTPYVLPVRRRVLAELRTRPGLTQREIAAVTGLSERVVSYHVGWLNTNGLVNVERTGASKRCFAAQAPAAGTGLPA